MAETAFPAPELGGKIADRYELLRFLGSGAIGAVYEARTPTNERVAVKVLLEIEQSALADELAKRFVREARLASTIDSDNVAGVVDSGVDETLGIPYLVMPLLSGFDLETLLENVGPLHPTVAVRIAAQACAGLMAAHKLSVVHRDIKPGNIFLDHQPDGRVITRVLDFGIAKQDTSDEQITRAGTVIGTPHYMAPEQSKNSKTVDARCDVWALAATLYHALSGMAPFEEATSFAELHISLNTQDVPSLQGRAGWLDPGLARVVHGGMLRDLDKRCPSMSEFRTALLPFLQGTTALSAGMLEGVPQVMRRVSAPASDRVIRWERSTPKVELPPMAEAETDVLLGKKLGGDYRLLRQLGRGSAGGLYEAIGDDGNRFAVRVLDPRVAGKEPKRAKRFVREARALAKIVSPHVVQPIDAGYDDSLDLPFVVVEMLHGMDLRAHLDRHGPLTPRLAISLFLQLCLGVEQAHKHGVIHRDIRPENLFLVEEPGGQVTVKLTGFGMVKQLHPADDDQHELTAGGDLIGSPLHMAPEQARNARNADARCDQFGVAASLFHALTGTPPWPRELTKADLLLHILADAPNHLQDHAPWVPKPLVDVIHRALKRDPSERWPDITAFAAALAALPHPEQVSWHQLNDALSSAHKARRAERAEPADPLPPTPRANDRELIDLSIADTQIAEADAPAATTSSPSGLPTPEAAPERAQLVAARREPPAPSSGAQRTRFVVMVAALALAAAALAAYLGAATGG